ncbi:MULTISPECIES: ABC transporter substrate-binding protein [unclassified Bradyrhizobium]|uniref:ABC transporter substrate-binding protein n=1 Tax=unclassified Bradyrhizobium TaxID=2631580 RepID=UPI001CD4A73B|nr:MULTISPECIES: ABC transporter substrate-binding protein [unclassified Bradyrhizobium]MCA1374948.1 ABC transporter substrate-binding protein [Bradyrhizobium sp. IC4060]MCA1484855.1 ABC transporter substrate-binding protein [Bradyrhizobium sp. IC4061]MCA1538464.1 ABC transporter substrate-binding protein [Bradyrhizobium sp. NBAIM32]
MHRRDLITLVGGAVMWPFAAQAQQSRRAWRLGYIGTGGLGDQLFEAFSQKLGALGYIQSKRIAINRINVTPDAKVIEIAITSLLPEIDILVMWGTLGAATAKRLTSDTPTVFLSVGAPVDIGLVQSLSHPGGNMTGVTFEAATETYAKRLQMLKEIIPTCERIAVLAAQGDPNVVFAMNSLERAAPTMNIELIMVHIKTPNDLPAAFDQIERAAVSGLIVIAGLFTSVNSRTIAELSLAHRIPSCHGFRESVVAGGLISLGPDLFAMVRQGAVFVDNIIRGARPADLPVEQPDRYEIYINLKTASILGIEIPMPLLARADKLID